MIPGKASGGFYGLRYLSIVATATIGLGIVAWIMQNRQLALATGVLGLYVLHLVSIRYILDNQREHKAALQTQWELLQRLVDPTEPIDGADERPALSNDSAAPGTNAGGGAESSSWPPLGLPLTTVGPDSDLAIPAGLEMPDFSIPAPPPVVNPGMELPLESDIPEIQPVVVTHQPVEVPIPRHFALGTVALIRQLLTPAEVARILMEQRRQPDKRFATLAVEMGLLEESQREELLLAQQEGLFTEEEMRQAREGLRQFRESTARALSDLG